MVRNLQKKLRHPTNPRRTVKNKQPEIMREDILVLPDDQFHTDNVCIVTGAGTSIGRATAIAAAANQLMTVGFDSNEDEGKMTQRLARETGGQMIFIHTDMENDDQIEYGVMEAAKLGSIKYLANIASIQSTDTDIKYPMKAYDWRQRILLRAPFYLSRLAIPYMKKSTDGQGVIANMASNDSPAFTTERSIYQMTKCTLRALSRTIAAEGEGKVRSFMVNTGFVTSPLTLNQIPAQAQQPGISGKKVAQDVMPGMPLAKKIISPIETANLLIFGFSRFARCLIGCDLLFDDSTVLTY